MHIGDCQKIDAITQITLVKPKVTSLYFAVLPTLKTEIV